MGYRIRENENFMKRLFILIVFAASLFFSCSHNFDDLHYTIENKSSMDVSFLFDGESITLQDGKSVSRIINSGKGRLSPQNVIFTGHPKSIRMETKGYSYSFIDIDPINLNVVNSLPIDVTLKAGDYIDNGSGSDEFFVPRGDEEIATIYTSKPDFTVVLPSGYPIIIDWEFSGDTVYVIIR